MRRPRDVQQNEYVQETVRKTWKKHGRRQKKTEEEKTERRRKKRTEEVQKMGPLHPSVVVRRGLAMTDSANGDGPISAKHHALGVLQVISGLHNWDRSSTSSFLATNPSLKREPERFRDHREDRLVSQRFFEPNPAGSRIDLQVFSDPPKEPGSELGFGECADKRGSFLLEQAVEVEGKRIVKADRAACRYKGAALLLTICMFGSY
ncbi:unnamed protein product [Pleuronectes platessa]|uniref:Uncharacterized protein n=1 Tax=Pleuronectes platessa TaxID=8262 RepID=A0A9N7TMH3_PLEPL|nr:unnamed protein product [Pleuronectes platessa]